MNSLVRDAAEFLGPELKSRNILLELDLASGLPVLEVDQDQLKQAFYNIVKNSSEAMKQADSSKSALALTASGSISTSPTPAAA